MYSLHYLYQATLAACLPPMLKLGKLKAQDGKDVPRREGSLIPHISLVGTCFRAYVVCYIIHIYLLQGMDFGAAVA